MSALGDLIAQVGDPALRSRLEEEARRVLEGRKFGLVFEEHLPDDTLLPGVPVRRGGLAARRGDAGGGLLRVLRVSGGKALCVDAAAVPGGTATEIPLGELVAAARPGEPVYPCLKEMDRIERGGADAPWHALIEADNAHALQFLQYVCGGKVDCIYVDPPYNTGARDWKYNNDYVDQNDSWRHSKWLSMMKRRLRLAKKLLNPKDSVLIVTIDEKEYLHLGCLLEEMFPEARIQMVSIITNKNGVQRSNAFKRTEEYAFYVMMGDAAPQEMPISDYSPFAISGKKQRTPNKESVRWERLLRGGSNSLRESRPNLFYPIYIDEEAKTIKKVGASIPLSTSRDSIPPVPGFRAIWPVRTNGAEATWHMQPSSLLKKMEKGLVRVGEYDAKNDRYTILYLADIQEARIANGDLTVTGKRTDGSLIVEYAKAKKTIPTTVWGGPLFSASEHGSRTITKFFGDKRFEFPKSYYATKLSMAPFVVNKPDALIVDFFAGSGTTLHAVNLLNAEDGGRRRCIMVTNNEVSEAEAKAMRERGLQAGDDEWEALGIARHVTWPRTVCSIEGHDVNGAALKGTYLGTEMAMANGFKANAAFYRLSFLDKDSVALGRALEALLPTLWMKSGARGAPPGGASLADSLHQGATESRTSEERARGEDGSCSIAGGTPAPPVLVFPENRFAVLTDERAMPRLKEALGDGEGWTAYLATDDGVAFRSMASELGRGVRCVQLYRDYLDNFRINRERE